MTSREGLQSADLVANFIMWRVSLLQLRPHLICEMSSHQDPCQMSTKEMPRAEVALHVNDMTNSKLNDAEWRIDKERYSRANPPPVVRV